MTGQETATRDIRSRQGRGIVGAALLLICVLALSLGGGFLWFIRHIPIVEAAPFRDADGIVVLTGGALRINDALDLMASGHGRRLLITGVHRTTGIEQLARLVPEHQRWLSCCVDLDRQATNTIGNATQARSWAEAQGFRSLIVVTTNYHMPRAMAEIRHALPQVTLVPYAVVSDRVRVETWWDNPATARLLILEYFKYVLARTRMILRASTA